MMKKVVLLVMMMLIVLPTCVFAEEVVENTSSEEVKAMTVEELLKDLYVVDERLNLDFPITKEHAVKLFLRLNENNYKISSFETPQEPSFRDVSADNPNYKYIEFAKSLGLVTPDNEGNFGTGNKVNHDYIMELLALNLGANYQEVVSAKDIDKYLSSRYAYSKQFYMKPNQSVKIGEAYAIFIDGLSLFNQQNLPYEDMIDSKNVFNTLGYSEIMSYDDFRKKSLTAYIPVKYDIKVHNISNKYCNTEDFVERKIIAIEWNTKVDLMRLKLEELQKSSLKELSYTDFISKWGDKVITVDYDVPDRYESEDGIYKEFQYKGTISVYLPKEEKQTSTYYVESSMGRADKKFEIIKVQRANIRGKNVYVLLVSEDTYNMYRKRPGFIMIEELGNGQYEFIASLSYGVGLGQSSY
ncbi:MAG: S-layer homology domain-containing protein [Firmicutes bacterium]|jgi:hypothetical protein|nr:S-layer homology domain-containing protein [Bacillota bacterium]